MTTIKWIRGLAIAAIAIVAIYLRADSLADPILWYDEAISALRSTGHSERDVVAYASSRGTIPIGDLQRFLRPEPDKNLADTMRSLITEDAQHTPVYYVVSHYWAKWVGADAATARSPAVLFSLLALPAVYWLCLELFVYTGAFSSVLVAWLGVVVVAVSPYDVAFGREHREYSLWMLALILLCAAFFRALRISTRASWLLFFGTLLLAAYTHLLTWLVWLVLAITLLIRERSFIRPATRGSIRSFALASIAAGLLFLPWALIVIENRAAIQSDLNWVNTLARPSRFDLYLSIYPHLRVGDLALLDIITPFETDLAGHPIRYFAQAFPIALLCGGLAYSRRLPRFSAAFITLLLIVLTLPVFLADFLTGGILGWVHRYAGPTILGWQLLITFLCASLLAVEDRWKQIRIAGVVLALAGSAYGAYSEHTSLYTFVKRPNDGGFVAEYLNSNNNTIVSDDYAGSLLSLSLQCRPEIPLLSRPRCPSCPDSRGLIEIPDAGATARLVYYRSWMNLGQEPVRKPFQDSLSQDRFGDARYHTSAVDHPTAALFLYDLKPR